MGLGLGGEGETPPAGAGASGGGILVEVRKRGLLDSLRLLKR